MRWALLFTLVACHKPAHDDFGPRFYSSSATGVVCSKGVDRGHEWKHEALVASLEHAHDHGVVLQTFGHAPTIDLAEYADDFDWAYAHGVPMVTFHQLAQGEPGAGWAFTVDDDEVDTWFSWRDFLAAHHVKVTFFVTKLDLMTPDQLQKLHQLAADGHDIEAHGRRHENASAYVAAHGLPAYLHDEVLVERDAFEPAGFLTPLAFAYPYGAHDAAIDAAMLGTFKLLRTTGAENCLK